jgi:PEP-CTERM motif
LFDLCLHGSARGHGRPETRKAMQAAAGLCLTGALVCLLVSPANATAILNGSFEAVNGPMTSFSIEDPSSNANALTGWTVPANPTGNQILDCVVFSGATNNLCGSAAFGGGFHFWVNPGSSPDGGNYFIADGDQTYSQPLQQTVAGLAVGGTYNLSFYQAAAQQDSPSFTSLTTEQWQVSLGSQTLTSTLMHNASENYVPWMSQTLTFTATAASEVLSFMAVGTPAGQPPFVLLDGVSITKTPEPATIALIGVSLVALGVAGKLRKIRG